MFRKLKNTIKLFDQQVLSKEPIKDIHRFKNFNLKGQKIEKSAVIDEDRFMDEK